MLLEKVDELSKAVKITEYGHKLLAEGYQIEVGFTDLEGIKCKVTLGDDTED